MTSSGVQRGQNVGLPGGQPRYLAVLQWSDRDGVREVDLSALLLAASGRVRSDDDMVFYNQPTSADGAVHYMGDTVVEERHEARVAIDLEELAPDVSAVALTASLDKGVFADLADLQLDLRDTAGESVLRFPLSDLDAERALLLGEVYRRDDAWRFRAIGQGWADGLAGLAVDFGIAVSEQGEDAPPVADRALPGQGAPDLPVPREVLDDRALPEGRAGEVGPDGHGEAPVLGPPESKSRSGRGASSARHGVQTRKTTMRPRVPPLSLAGDETWQAARLFSISGVGPAAEQEKRATSALLATLMAVRPFGRSVTARFGAPSGAIETYLEVPFPLGDRAVSPDGVVRIARGGRVWTALVETKTGSSVLSADQVENYLDVARDQSFDAVITLSNDIAPAAGSHPVEVNKRKLKNVALHHVSWAEVLHDARMVLSHGTLADPMQAWILHELVRYLTHPRSGAATFVDMGAAWVPVRDAVAAGTLRASDRKTPLVAESWARLVRQLAMELTADLGANVTQVLPRRLSSDHDARRNADAEQLATAGTLTATLRIPDAAGLMTVIADLRTSQVRVSATVDAPAEGSAQRRVGWLLRQLKAAPDGLLVEVLFSSRTESTCELLGDVRERPATLLHDRADDVKAFRLTSVEALGTKRSGVRAAFIPSVLGAVEAFYRHVLQPVRSWTPPAPKLAPGSLTGTVEADLTDVSPAAQDHPGSSAE